FAASMADEGSSRAAELIVPLPAPELPSPPRKPRGRPLGSKNKPKPPVVVTRESEAAMRPVVLELDAGCDVATAVAAFARRRCVGVSVLCGRGTVATVTLRLPTSPATAVTLHGRFEVLSLSGTVVPSAAGEGAAPPPFSVSLAGAGGQVIGGTLAGQMTAADGLVVVAATFGSAEVHRLPPAEDEEVAERRSGEERRHPHQHQPQPSPQKPFAAASAVDVGVGALPRGYGGAVVGLAGTGGASGGQVGRRHQQAEMVLWAQAPGSVGPAHPAGQKGS
ncbi:AT-hook motif nuclear-localized protein 27-like, partial [Oryza brachyantha]|uniref:AT-hook motif nuclear-localized protein 27-like n=1 Tax=Oryza brachyantha TaxID=4533 RepID=UPI001ADAD55C